MGPEASGDIDRAGPEFSAGSPLDEVLTSRQAAALLQLRPSTVEDYARRGVLPSLKLGWHRRFVRAQVEEAIIALLAG